MTDDIEKILFSAEELDRIVTGLGEQISKDYEDKNLLMISILKGSVIIMADLMRKISVPAAIDFMAVTSYGSGTKTSGSVKILKDLDRDIKGYDVLIVEDILDSGVTLSYLKKMFESKGPQSIKICTLFDKPERRIAQVKPDYVGAEVPDLFIVGYGLDYNEKYRNLPFVGVLKEEIYLS